MPSTMAKPGLESPSAWISRATWVGDELSDIELLHP